MNNLDKPINFTNGPRGIAPISKPPLFFQPVLEFFGLQVPEAKLYPLYFYFLILFLVCLIILGHPAVGKLARRACLESDP